MTIISRVITDLQNENSPTSHFPWLDGNKFNYLHIKHWHKLWHLITIKYLGATKRQSNSKQRTSSQSNTNTNICSSVHKNLVPISSIKCPFDCHCSSWNGGYIRNFPLLPFGVPNAPTVLGVGGTHPPQVWWTLAQGLAPKPESEKTIMNWTALEPGETNWLDIREPHVTNWPGDRHVGIYASPDNWCTCLFFVRSLAQLGVILLDQFWRMIFHIKCVFLDELHSFGLEQWHHNFF